MLGRLVWLTPLLLLGCLDAFAPAVAVPLTPPAVYRVWWTEMERCAGLWGVFDRVERYEGRCDGSWRAPHTIYMAQSRLYDRQLAEHEMLHDLLQRGDHPPVFKACG